jgi:hypothetical protein
MLALLRRSRALALALVLLAPGVSGSAVQWLHACPAAPQRGTEHQHHGSGQSGSGQLPLCECIGTCRTGVLLTPPSAASVVAVVTQPDHRIILPSGIRFVARGTPSDFLPPSTAPPLS